MQLWLGWTNGRQLHLLIIQHYKKVSYREQMARQYSWSTVYKFSLREVDHRAKFGC